jgi:hypothetical protein
VPSRRLPLMSATRLPGRTPAGSSRGCMRRHPRRSFRRGTVAVSVTALADAETTVEPAIPPPVSPVSPFSPLIPCGQQVGRPSCASLPHRSGNRGVSSLRTSGSRAGLSLQSHPSGPATVEPAPVAPVSPFAPVAPVAPCGPVAPVSPVCPAGPIGPVSPE